MVVVKTMIEGIEERYWALVAWEEENYGMRSV